MELLSVQPNNNNIGGDGVDNDDGGGGVGDGSVYDTRNEFSASVVDAGVVYITNWYPSHYESTRQILWPTWINSVWWRVVMIRMPLFQWWVSFGDADDDVDVDDK
mmetsp:Transcript_23075/g.25720  ORF Transcript_23075/g.25720 Transcript_23075/m.25720 type:complete len:105 (+) Transcript_23075:257-571(+)